VTTAVERAARWGIPYLVDLARAITRTSQTQAAKTLAPKTNASTASKASVASPVGSTDRQAGK
jgi:hypothetical protein